VFKVDKVVAGVIPAGDDKCRFDAGVLEDVLQILIKDQLKDANAPMADPSLMSPVDDRKRCPTFVVATRVADAERPPVLFRSHNCPEDYDADKCRIWEAARCTSAAPTFFRPMFVTVPPGSGQWYLDGGLQHNNPSKLALDEARRLWPTVKRFYLVSIGTGQQGTVEFMDIKDTPPPQPALPDKKLNNAEALNSKGQDSGSSSKDSRAPTPKPTGLLRKFRDYTTTSKKAISLQLSKVVNAPKGFLELQEIAKEIVELSTRSERVHQEMSVESNSKDPSRCFPYCRFNVDRGMETVGLQEWKAKVRIEELTMGYMDDDNIKRKKNGCAEMLWRPSEIERM
jgi:predicted acylesterase/phospholipase RssA